jgi:hypothetical protein
MNPMISFSLVILISCPCNQVDNGVVISGSFAMLIKLENRDANMITQVTMYVEEIMARRAVRSCVSFADTLRWGETSLAHRIRLGDWWERPVCRYSITGQPNGVMRTMAAGWTG